MSGHEVERTTHTQELTQLQEINARLQAQPATGPTAEALGLTGAELEQVTHTPFGAARGEARADGLPGSAVLIRVAADGPPNFPYIHGRFRIGPEGTEASSTVLLHTEALQSLSHRLGLHHSWGF